MPLRFEVVDVSAWAVDREEPVGTGEGVWLAEPRTATKWIYKPATVKDGVTYGDDWAEKAAGEVARLLAVPSAQVELAVRDGRPGVISRSLRPATHDLVEGNLLLSAARAPGYVLGRAPGRPGRTPANIRWRVIAPAGCRRARRVLRLRRLLWVPRARCPDRER